MGHETLGEVPGRLPAGSDFGAETMRRSCQPGDAGGGDVPEETKTFFRV